MISGVAFEHCSTSCCDIGQNDIFSRIEFKQASILSSDNTNYKNDIQ